MRSIAVVISLLLSSLVFAETQEDVYYKALQAEERGDVSESMSLYEQAAEMDGEYTEEIREILKEYYDALGMTGNEPPWSFRVLGDVGYYGLHYEEYGGVPQSKENGGDVFTSLQMIFDFNVGNWIHSFGMAFVSDWFISNKDMPQLDTNDWTLAPGLEYTLVGNTLLLDVGVDFNVSDGVTMKPSFYAWLENDFFRKDKQRFGAALWAYYRSEGPASFALYGSWKKNVLQGLSWNVHAGLKYDADSIADFVQFLENVDVYNAKLAELEQAAEEHTYEYYFDQCVAQYGEPRCRDEKSGVLESVMYPGLDELQEEIKDLDYYWTRWIGPSIRSNVSYAFRNNFSVDGKLNLMYGFVVDGASSVYDDLQKFTGTWGASVNWNPSFFTLYFGLEQIYVHYSMPGALEGVYPENSFLSEFKLGAKFEL